MLTVAEAIDAILNEVRLSPSQRVPLHNALGQVLSEDAISDLDSPPFDKSLMDGYAVRTADVAGGPKQLRVVEEVMAGQVPRKPVGPGEAIRIMTGAPIPLGADAVVPVEQTRLNAGDREAFKVHIDAPNLTVGKNILKRGSSTLRGTRVIPKGRLLRPQEIGALAELGKSEVSINRAPRVSVLATGNELVPIDEVPGPGQIRNSNEPMLVAQLRNMGAIPSSLGVARDDPADLRNRINQGLLHDVLMLSGGVSAGELDLVPGVLVAAGVRNVFHKVRVKPGQPLWFGVAEGHSNPAGAASPARCYVFGLPGNPVSSMVCCELFVRPALRRMMGIDPAVPEPVRARLTRQHFSGGNRPTYHPARCVPSETGFKVEPVKWAGSADLCATVEANAMALFPGEEQLYEAGTLLDVYLW
jgi:molybdopterin molybdotransferase